MASEVRFYEKINDALSGWVLSPAGWVCRKMILYSQGETLIGSCTAKTASMLGEVFGSGPWLEKGAEMDHMEIGAQRYCIWKANFPGCCRLKMSNCLKKQTPWHNRHMQWGFQDVPNRTACSTWHWGPPPQPPMLSQQPRGGEEKENVRLKERSWNTPSAAWICPLAIPFTQ